MNYVTHPLSSARDQHLFTEDQQIFLYQGIQI